MLQYDLFSVYELNEVSKICHVGFIQYSDSMKANPMYEHEYYAKVKGEAASLHEDKLTEY